jgi:hypothetical protein
MNEDEVVKCTYEDEVVKCSLRRLKGESPKALEVLQTRCSGGRFSSESKVSSLITAVLWPYGLILRDGTPYAHVRDIVLAGSWE